MAFDVERNQEYYRQRRWPSEPPWTAAKSALEQEATRAGSIRPTAAGGDCE
ncbi:hypothetical protein [Yersinia enterocolitica]|uniref:hypothetical protein n=1 Tax=Yersinia enterocolitica TaxID=630 RepID=UPI00398CBF03